MGAGKTSVGRRLAERLGWRFFDLDAEVERKTGLSIEEIFDRWGEDRFRVLEVEVGNLLLVETEAVVATGGGWAASPERRGELPAGTLSIWLRVHPEEAVRRAQDDARARPMLDVEDPIERARELLIERTPLYEAATLRVDTEGRAVDDVTSRILEILETHGMEFDPE